MIQIPAKNVQMKARLILFTEEAKIARERKMQTNLAVKNRNKTSFKCKQVKKASIRQLFRNSSTFRQL